MTMQGATRAAAADCNCNLLDKKWQIAPLIISKQLRQKNRHASWQIYLQWHTGRFRNGTHLGISWDNCLLTKQFLVLECIFSPWSLLFKCLNSSDVCRVYLPMACKTYLYKPQTEGRRELDCSHPRSRSATNPHGHWSCVPDSASTEGPERKTCRSHGRMLEVRDRQRPHNNYKAFLNKEHFISLPEVYIFHATSFFVCY